MSRTLGSKAEQVAKLPLEQACSIILLTLACVISSKESEAIPSKGARRMLPEAVGLLGARTGFGVRPGTRGTPCRGFRSEPRQQSGEASYAITLARMISYRTHDSRLEILRNCISTIFIFHDALPRTLARFAVETLTSDRARHVSLDSPEGQGRPGHRCAIVCVCDRSSDRCGWS